MKSQIIKFNIFQCLVATLLTTCFALNAKAGTRNTNTLQGDTTKIFHAKAIKMETSNEQVSVFATYRIKEGQLNTVLNLVSELVKKTRAEKGNLYYKVHQSKSEVNTIIFYEGYTDETALAAHRNSAHYQSLIKEKILPLLEDRKVVLATELFPN